MNQAPQRGFGSDNFAPVHPRVLAALVAANQGHVPSYGNDPYTRKAEELFRGLFGAHSAAYFVFNGTAANILAMRGHLEPFSAIICAETAHIHCDEAGAPEQLSGAKLLTVPGQLGKIRPEDFEHLMQWRGNEHRAQPRWVSLTQATELGTVYTPNEIAALAKFCHKHGMYLHVDGARIANALVHLNCTAGELLVDTGVDVVSFGGTKNGMMFGEAVVFPDAKLAARFPYLRKNMAQLHSKMRYISAQFCAMLEDGLWLENALAANGMAALLGKELAKIPGVELVAPVQANGVFAKIPQSSVLPLQQHRFFYLWDRENTVARFMLSFDSDSTDVLDFCAKMREILGIPASMV